MKQIKHFVKQVVLPMFVPGGWVSLQADIQGWPGIDTPLSLVFRATTDWAFPTDFTLDNIRFITTCH